MTQTPLTHEDPSHSDPRCIRAVVTQAQGSIDEPEALVDTLLPMPEPQAHDVLIDVRAISVNPVDTKVREGGARLGHPLGWDAAGVITAVGAEVTLFNVGDEVYVAGDVTRDGSNQDFVLADERLVAHKPASLSFADSAAVPLVFLTAWEALFDKLQISKDAHGTIFVQGGAGGTGSAVIQLVKQLTHLTVITTASREESLVWERELGADVVLNYKTDDIPGEVQRIAPHGVDYIFSSRSRGSLPLFLEIIKPFGEIVAIDDDDFELRKLKPKALTWHWEYMFARSTFAADDLIRQHEILTQVAEYLDRGMLKSPVTKVVEGITAENLRAVHKELEAGHTTGKIVLTR